MYECTSYIYDYDNITCSQCLDPTSFEQDVMVEATFHSDGSFKEFAIEFKVSIL